MSDDRTQRLGFFCLGKHQLLPVLSGECTISGWPADARVEDVGWDLEVGGWRIVVSIDSFSPVPEGDRIPFIGPLNMTAAPPNDMITNAVKFREFL